jgi:hypothetical protein
LNHAFSISVCIANHTSQVVFHGLHIAIQAYNAFLFASINFAHAGFLSSHQIIIEIAASVFIHTSLSFIQKSNLTKSQFLNTSQGLAVQ